MQAGNTGSAKETGQESYSMPDRSALKGEAPNGNYFLHDMEGKPGELPKWN